MTATRENLNYSKRQIEKVFGVGKHSAGIAPVDAAFLANDPSGLAERVYGLGNPYKAKELGNIQLGDAFYFRGIGPFQHTGRSAIDMLMKKAGVATINDLLHPNYLFFGAIDFWRSRNLNNFADMNDPRAIRKLVNGGYNGYDDFLKMYNRIYSDLTSGKNPNENAKSDQGVLAIQRMLVDLKYRISLDGIYGAQTKDAVIDFQKRNGLVVDGIAGAVTIAKMKSCLGAKAAVNPPDVPVLTEDNRRAAAVGGVSLGAASEILTSTARQITDLQLSSPIFDLIPVVLILAGLGIMVWPILKGAR